MHPTKSLSHITGTAILVVASGILVVSGFAMGYYYHATQNPDRVKSLQESQVVQTVNAFATGTLRNIEGRILTISNGKDTMSIPIREGANIARLLPPKDISQALPEREQIDFQDLKMGDRINVFTEVTLEGSLEGIGVDVITP